MSYDPSFPADDGILADFPPGYREQIRALVEDAVVNALKIQGLTPGNASGNIPISNGTKNQNLNADMLDGKDSADFAAVNHVHGAATTSTNGFMSNTDKAKVDGIAAGAEVNQMAFSNVLVGSTTIQADAKTDTLEIVAGTNIALTPDATNDRLTIGVTGTVAAATTAGTCTGNAATATNATNHIAAATSAHAASAIAFTPTGNISGANVQAAIAELDTEKQPIDATLTALAALVTAADRLIYSTGIDTFSLTALTSFARTLLDDADAAAARTTLGAAPLASPALTGTPTAPTAAVGTNTTQIATTAFVQAAAAAAAYDAAHSFAVNGYQKLSNGLIFQWGRATGVNPAQYNFPIAYPTACLGVYITRIGGNNYVNVQTWTTTYFTGDVTVGSSNKDALWFSIGY